MNVETVHAIHALQLLEAVKRDLARASDELQKLRSLLLVKGPDGAPEPLDLLRGRRVVLVLGVTLPVINVDVW